MLESNTNSGPYYYTEGYTTKEIMAAVEKAKAIKTEAVPVGSVYLLNPGDFEALRPKIDWPELRAVEKFNLRMRYETPMYLEPRGIIHGTFDVPEKPRRQMKPVEYVAVIAAAVVMFMLLVM